MADEDDLDAFFDEVSEVEAKAVEETDKVDDKEASKKGKSGDDDQPPTKRLKTTAVARPRGVVVAASTSVVMPVEEREQKEAQLEASLQNSVNDPHQSSTFANGRGGATNPNSSIGPAFPGAAAGNPTPNNPHAASEQKKGNSKVAVRTVAGKTWIDKSLEEWPDNDFRIFVGNLSNEVTDQMLFKHFEKYPSLARARVVRDIKNPEKSKGYGFVSLLDPLECARALREMDQTWLASRPIRIKRSDWKDRDYKVVKKREKKEKKQQKRMGMRF